MNSKQDMRMSLNKLKSKKNISMKIQQKSTKQDLWVQNPGPGATERNQADSHRNDPRRLPVMFRPV